jgi:hypothetical protein
MIILNACFFGKISSLFQKCMMTWLYPAVLTVYLLLASPVAVAAAAAVTTEHQLQESEGTRQSIIHHLINKSIKQRQYITTFERSIEHKCSASIVIHFFKHIEK